jgi:hypothetical protein
VFILTGADELLTCAARRPKSCGRVARSVWSVLLAVSLYSRSRDLLLCFIVVVVAENVKY